MMAEYDNGFARAQEMYDRQEPPDYSQDPCKNCDAVNEEHMYLTDGEGHEFWICPAMWETVKSDHMFDDPDEDDGPDPDRARDEAIDREMDPDRGRDD